MTPDVPSLVFENLRDDIEALQPAADPSARLVRWAGDTLAYARNNERCLEIFIQGPPLQSRIRGVRDRLRHDLWNHEERGGSIEATRLILPRGDHMDAIAATILVELQRNDVQHSPQTAFSRTEPLIEIVLHSAIPQSHVLTGLAGELATLEQLMANGILEPRQAMTHWKGYMPSTRDIQLDHIGIEIKATTMGGSRHAIEGWYQVEPGVATDSATVETQLYLLSIGIDWHPHESTGMTIEGLIQGIGSRLTADDRADLRTAIRQYCGDFLSLDDRNSAGGQAFKRPFTIGFARMYDMNDSAIRVLRSEDIVGLNNVVSDSVSFKIELPKVINSENPIHGWRDVIHSLRV